PVEVAADVERRTAGREREDVRVRVPAPELMTSVDRVRDHAGATDDEAAAPHGQHVDVEVPTEVQRQRKTRSDPADRECGYVREQNTLLPGKEKRAAHEDPTCRDRERVDAPVTQPLAPRQQPLGSL